MMTIPRNSDHTIDKETINTILVSLAVNLGILLVLLLLFSPIFETNDDSGLRALVCGARGVRDPHMVYSNYLLGQLLVTLFKAAPGIQWTGVLQYICLLLSFTAITFVFLKQVKWMFTRALFLSVLMLFSYEAYILIQYTKTAGILVAAGMILVFHGLKQKEVVKTALIMGALLVITGSLFRIQQAYCEILVFAPLMLYLAFKDQESREQTKKRVLRVTAAGIALLSLVLLFRAYDRFHYSDKEWSEYLEYDEYRSKVIDYGIPKYDEHKEEYSDLGIDRTSYDLMRGWTFQDDERFTTEVFKGILKIRGKKKIDLPLVLSFIKTSAKELLREDGFLCFMVIAFCWLFYSTRGKKEWLCVILVSSVIAVIYFYLFYAGRFMMHHVDVGIWFSAVMILFLLFEDKKFKMAPALATLAVLLICLTLLPWKAQLRFINSDDALEMDKKRKTIEELNSDNSHIYLTKIGTLKFYEAYGVFEPMPYKCADNIYPLGGWTAATPTSKEVLRKYDIDNPFRDMVNNETVYIIDNDIDSTVRYIRKWYDPKAKAEKVKDVNGRKVYRIIS